MEGYDASTYGDRIADVYDEMFEGLFDAQATADFLAELAGPGPVLELGIGTGRIAIPLAERGVGVHGVDASPAMVEKMRDKPGGQDIPVTIGDFTEFDIDERFRLAFIVFNTFFGLPSQEDQIRCFQTVASHLTDDGVFVMEAFVPDLARFDREQRVSADRVGVDAVELETTRHDPVHQRCFSQRIVATNEGIRMYPVHVRYAFPSELDLMARLAGLVLRDRWAGWKREPFTSEAKSHVSVYERA
jgi:SAM-dependent methyltransferase